MGRMKDYGMWLEEKGYAVWDDRTDSLEYTADYDAAKAFDEYQHDTNWHGTSTEKTEDE